MKPAENLDLNRINYHLIEMGLKVIYVHVFLTLANAHGGALFDKHLICA